MVAEVIYEPCDQDGNTAVTKKPRKPNDIWLLATWFADLCFSGGWYSSGINQGEFLKAASNVVKGYSNKTKGTTYPPRTIALVRETVEALWYGAFPDFDKTRLTSLYCVNWGAPICYADLVASGKHIPLPCPVWHEQDYQKWQLRWGDSYVKYHPDYKDTLDKWRNTH